MKGRGERDLLTCIKFQLYKMKKFQSASVQHCEYISILYHTLKNLLRVDLMLCSYHNIIKNNKTGGDERK